MNIGIRALTIDMPTFIGYEVSLVREHRLSTWWSTPVLAYGNPHALSITSKVCGHVYTVQRCPMLHKHSFYEDHSQS